MAFGSQPNMTMTELAINVEGKGGSVMRRRRVVCRVYLEAFMFLHNGRPPVNERDYKSLPLIYFQYQCQLRACLKIQPLVRGFLDRRRTNRIRNKRQHQVRFDILPGKEQDGNANDKVVTTKANTSSPSNKTDKFATLEQQKKIVKGQVQMYGKLLKEKKDEYISLEEELAALKNCSRTYPSTCMSKLQYPSIDNKKFEKNEDDDSNNKVEQDGSVCSDVFVDCQSQEDVSSLLMNSLVYENIDYKSPLAPQRIQALNCGASLFQSN